MVVLVYMTFSFVLFQFFNVMLNLVFRQKLSASNSVIKNKISVLIPARNEETNIALLLEDLIKIDCNILEILVYDDQSTDNTAAVVKNVSTIDSRVRLIYTNELPNNWLGKNHACYQLAQQARGYYYLYLDADVRIKGNIIKDAVFYLDKHHISLLSVFPVQIQQTWGEKLSVSVMNYILVTLLPLVFVRISPFSSHSAANGQFMLFTAQLYNKLQPHEKFKSYSVEDIAIANFYKRNKIKIACLIGDKRIRCRMYKNYNEALNGFSKNVFSFFGNNVLFAFLFWCFSLLGFIPVLLLAPFYCIVYLIFVIFILIGYTSLSRQNVISNILLFPLQMCFLLQVMIKSILQRNQKTWKGRNIYL